MKGNDKEGGHWCGDLLRYNFHCLAMAVGCCALPTAEGRISAPFATPRPGGHSQTTPHRVVGAPKISIIVTHHFAQKYLLRPLLAPDTRS